VPRSRTASQIRRAVGAARVPALQTRGVSARAVDASGSPSRLVPVLPRGGRHGERGQGVVTRAAAGASEEGDRRLAALVRFLLLSHNASKAGSLFALEQVIAAAVEAFAAGYSMDDIKNEVTLLAMSIGPANFTPMEQDVVVSRVCLVMSTLTELGLVAPEGGGLPDREDRTYSGLRSFAAKTLARVSEGFTLQRVLLTQQMTPEEERSPVVLLMQENTRVVLLTLQVSQKIRTAQIVGDFVTGEEGAEAQVPMPEPAGPSVVDEDNPRSAAIRLLLAFIGIILGLPTSLRSFVDEAHAAYRKGWSAQLLVDQLEEDEFVQTRGIVPTVAGSDLELAEKINGVLIARFLSLVYMTWAYAGVEFPGAKTMQGWAWPTVLGMPTDAVEANNWGDFVLKTMKKEAMNAAAQAGAAGESGTRQVAEGSARRESRAASKGSAVQGGGSPGIVALPDPSLVQTSPTLALMKRQTAIIETALMLVDGPQWWTLMPVPDENDNSPQQAPPASR